VLTIFRAVDPVSDVDVVIDANIRRAANKENCTPAKICLKFKYFYFNGKIFPTWTKRQTFRRLWDVKK